MTGTRQRFLRIRDFEYPLPVGFSLAQSFQEWPDLWKNRNREAGCRLMSKGYDAARFQIDVAATQRTGLSLAESRQSEKLQKVSAFLRVGVENFGPHIGNDRFELLKARRQSNWLLAFG